MFILSLCDIQLTISDYHQGNANKETEITQIHVLFGISFIRENICNLENEKAGHMPVGFELAFGSLLEKAWNLGIGVPQDSPVL